MRHTNWLHLKREGERICSLLRQQGYQCRKQARTLAWKVRKEGIDPYVFKYEPAPVGEWNLIPFDFSPAREQLLSLLQGAGLTISEKKVDSQVTVTQLSVNSAPSGDSTCQKPSLPTTNQLNQDLTRPWVIVRLLPDARRYTIARFYNRSDAFDHKRTLNRFLPAAEFEVVFEPHPL